MKNKILPTTMILTFTAILLITSAMTAVASAEYTITITDLSGNTVSLTYDQLLAMPKTTENADLYCYGLLVTGGEWGGVKLSDVVAQINLDSTVSSIQFLAQDGYSISIPIDIAMQPDTIIAYEKDAVPLQETLRLVVPEANGNFWISKITAINLTTSKVDENLSGNYVRTTPQLKPTPQPTQTPIQPIATPKSEPTVEPSASPESTIQPEQQQNITKQNTIPQKLGLPVEVVYGTAIAFGAVAVVSVVNYRRKKL